MGTYEFSICDIFLPITSPWSQGIRSYSYLRRDSSDGTGISTRKCIGNARNAFTVRVLELIIVRINTSSTVISHLNDEELYIDFLVCSFVNEIRTQTQHMNGTFFHGSFLYDNIMPDFLQKSKTLTSLCLITLDSSTLCFYYVSYLFSLHIVLLQFLTLLLIYVIYVLSLLVFLLYLPFLLQTATILSILLSLFLHWYSILGHVSASAFVTTDICSTFFA